MKGNCKAWPNFPRAWGLETDTAVPDWFQYTSHRIAAFLHLSSLGRTAQVAMSPRSLQYKSWYFTLFDHSNNILPRNESTIHKWKNSLAPGRKKKNDNECKENLGCSNIGENVKHLQCPGKIWKHWRQFNQYIKGIFDLKI